MSRSSYLRIRQVSEAGLISETLRLLAAEAKRTRAQTALRVNRVTAIGRASDKTGEQARRQQRRLDLTP